MFTQLSTRIGLSQLLLWQTVVQQIHEQCAGAEMLRMRWRACLQTVASKDSVRLQAIVWDGLLLNNVAKEYGKTSYASLQTFNDTSGQAVKRGCTSDRQCERCTSDVPHANGDKCCCDGDHCNVPMINKRTTTSTTPATTTTTTTTDEPKIHCYACGSIATCSKTLTGSIECGINQKCETVSQFGKATFVCENKCMFLAIWRRDWCTEMAWLWRTRSRMFTVSVGK